MKKPKKAKKQEEENENFLVIMHADLPGEWDDNVLKFSKACVGICLVEQFTLKTVNALVDVQLIVRGQAFTKPDLSVNYDLSNTNRALVQKIRERERNLEARARRRETKQSSTDCKKGCSCKKTRILLDEEKAIFTGHTETITFEGKQIALTRRVTVSGKWFLGICKRQQPVWF